MPALRTRVSELQKITIEENIPVIVIFEGWSSAGKSKTVQHLSSQLDPAHFRLYPSHEYTSRQQKHAWRWHYWMTLPKEGHWGIFENSWYSKTLQKHKGESSEEGLNLAFQEIVDYEDNLVQDQGYIIQKYFLHISQKKTF